MGMDGFMTVSSILIIVATAVTLGLILMTPLTIVFTGVMYGFYSLTEWYENNFFPHELNKKIPRLHDTAASRPAIRNTHGGPQRCS